MRFLFLTGWLFLSFACDVVSYAAPGNTAGTLMPRPSTDFRNNPDEFHFAIISDLTGSQQEGVWADALRKIDLMQPEFVVSLGDVIEGFADDSALIEGESDVAEQTIKTLDAPFFYLHGNHDYTNKTMAAIWKRKFGQPYYHFVYRDVLFMVLNSQISRVNGARHDGLGEEQVAYFRKVLEQNKSVRWTLVFMHVPLWASEPDSGWLNLEKPLAGRHYSVFAGHTHEYVKFERNGAHYFTLSSTGAGNDQKGPSFGSFYQIAWVTMKKESGPVIANLMLDGILDENIVTEATRPLVQGLEVQATPVIVANKTFAKGTSTLSITNKSGVPLVFSAAFKSFDGIWCDPASINLSMAANSVTKIPLLLSAPKPITGMPPVASAAFEWRAHFSGTPPLNLDLRDSVKVPVIAPYAIMPAKKPVAVDGTFDEWPALPVVVDTPGTREYNAETWTGPDDCRFRLGLMQDEKKLYIAVEVTDDIPVFAQGVNPWKQDGFEIRFDARPDSISANSRSEGWLFAFCPAEKDKEMFAFNAQYLPPEITYACIRTKKGFNAEIAIPFLLLDQQQGGTWKRVRMNVAIDDYDAPGKGAQLWWNPDWRFNQNVPGSGTFERAKQ